VVIPTYNGGVGLADVLAAALAQDYRGDYEVVVVDDGSRDETPRVLEEWQARHPRRLRCFRQENGGPARARNRGAQEARGRLLAFIDDDCVAEPSWLTRLEAAVEESGAEAAAGAVVNRETSWVGRYVNRESIIDHHFDLEGRVAEMVTGNAGVRADVFRELGGFDETIRVAGGEDTEFGLRLRQGGRRIVHAPLARIHHPAPASLGEYLRMIFRHGQGRRRLGERFPDYRIRFPYLRILWLLWPLRAWMVRDYRRYRNASVDAAEARRYVFLRYLENPARVAGYIRGT
jgi:GT2 family glycosyltransferase